MKTRKFLFTSMIVLTAAAVAFTGCRKKEEEDNDTSAASDNALAESSFNDMGTIAEQGSEGTVTSFKSGDDASLLSACALVTINNAVSSNNDTITVDFGSTNCLCNDGRYRRGKVIAIYTGGANYRDSGLVATITPSNYFVNDNQVLGTKTVQNMGHINNGRLQWNITVNGQIIKANGGGTISWVTNKTKVLLAGETTFGGPINWLIAKWEISGNVNGTAANGDSFSAITTTPLVRDMTCGTNRKHFQSGKFEFTPGSRPTRYVDFDVDENSSNGYTCDDLARVTINNNSYTIHLH